MKCTARIRIIVLNTKQDVEGSKHKKKILAKDELVKLKQFLQIFYCYIKSLKHFFFYIVFRWKISLGNVSKQDAVDYHVCMLLLHLKYLLMSGYFGDGTEVSKTNPQTYMSWEK